MSRPVTIRPLAVGCAPLRDPRLYQIAVLGSLLVYGIGWLDFEVGLAQAGVTLATVLLTQYFATRIWQLSVYDPRSALISGLSLCLLLRTNTPALAVAAGVVAILSKILVRPRGKHLFNPTNFGPVVMMLVNHPGWGSPRQWGGGAVFAVLLACLGGVVGEPAARR